MDKQVAAKLFAVKPKRGRNESLLRLGSPGSGVALLGENDEWPAVARRIPRLYSGILHILTENLIAPGVLIISPGRLRLDYD
jgi:hypothetical protein